MHKVDIPSHTTVLGTKLYPTCYSNNKIWNFMEESVLTKVFLHQNMATSYQRMDIKNSKYTARDNTLQISMLYGKILFRVTIQGETLEGEMWNGG
jgi:predicted membrane-bound dolichyl-phosphate-mannose-protein mannosyltransferase